MRPNDLIPAVLLLGLAGCQLQDLGPGDSELGVTQQKTIGGEPAQGQPHYEAVAAITVLLPLPSEDQDPAQTPRTEYRYCTGVLVEARTVMTAAGCLARNLEFELDEDRPEPYLDSESVVVQFGSSASAGTEYYLDASLDTRPDSDVSVLGLTMHRYYSPDSTGLNDIALLRLSADPGITPVAVNGEALTDAREGTPLELVGYGRNDDLGDKLTFTARNVVSPLIDEVTATRVTAGSAAENTCYADQGGPGFLVFEDVPEDVPKVATVSVMHRTGDCLAVPARQRVDLYYEDFIAPFIKFHSGDCDVDPACVACDYNGVCEEDCPTRDWDCPLSAFPGDACNVSGDCEEGGSCVAAGDDPSFTYCDKPCDADVDNACPSDMQCQEGTCVYAGISPGSQGAACSTPADCRSGYCENTLCAFECDASDPNACDSDNDFFCLPSADDGTPVCRKDTRTGGGGFCAISPAGSQHSHRNGFLVCFGLVFLATIFRRRRCK